MKSEEGGIRKKVDGRRGERGKEGGKEIGREGGVDAIQEQNRIKENRRE